MVVAVSNATKAFEVTLKTNRCWFGTVSQKFDLSKPTVVKFDAQDQDTTTDGLIEDYEVNPHDEIVNALEKDRVVSLDPRDC